MKTGILYLFPSFLSGTNDASVIPALNIEIIRSLDHFIVENIRTARRFMRKIGYDKDFENVGFYELNKHTDPGMISSYLNEAINGNDMGVISEAGAPCIADPGSVVVSVAHELDIRVVPLPGPSSIFLALMASGFNGQSFTFHAYLPIDKRQRNQKIREMESNIFRFDQTQVFMETPYRNKQLFEALLSNCQKDTCLCVASMLTHKEMEFVKTKSIHDWEKNPPELHKKPTIFLLYK
ncbi:MAG: SAM-dependent methyltransferase [Bacteroidales bacterium]|nr:SAM-dependent methyltransferase [Bacteroidales bacterium]